MEKERLLLSLNLLLLFFGHGIYGVFVPIFLMKNGAGMAGALMYVLSDGIGSLMGAIVGVAIIRRTGLRFPLLLRAVVQPLWILWLKAFPVSPAPVQLYGSAFGFFTTLYWLSVNTYIIQASGRKDRGTFTGAMSAMMWLASIAAPLAGALVIGRLGYDFLFDAATVFLLAAAVPAFLLPNVSLEETAAPTRPKGLRKEADEKAGVFFFLYAITGALSLGISYLWTLHVYRLFGSELPVGAFASLASLAGLIGAMGGGWLSDRTSKTRVMAASSILSAAGWFVSIATVNPLALAAIVGFRNLGNEAASNALFAKYGNFLTGGKALQFMAQKQLMQATGYLTVTILAFSLPFVSMFAIFGMLNLLYAAVVAETKFPGERISLPKPFVRWLMHKYRVA